MCQMTVLLSDARHRSRYVKTSKKKYIYITNHTARRTVSKPNHADGGESCVFWRHSYAVTWTWHTERLWAGVPNTSYIRTQLSVTYADIRPSSVVRESTQVSLQQLSKSTFMPRSAAETRWHKRDINSKPMNHTELKLRKSQQQTGATMYFTNPCLFMVWR
jgi:D-alanyl-D-alanine carboxypeptidase